MGWRVSGDVQGRSSEVEALRTSREAEEAVLVVSEDFATRQSLISVLDAAGIEAFGAEAKEALGTQSLHQPGVAVVEHTVSGSDGVAMAGWLKERDPEIQVLLLTDPVSLDTVQPSAAVDGYLVKPLASAAFVPTVRGAFSHRALALANKRLVAHEERAEEARAPAHPSGITPLQAPAAPAGPEHREPARSESSRPQPINLQPLQPFGSEAPKRSFFKREPRNQPPRTLEPVNLEAPAPEQPAQAPARQHESPTSPTSPVPEVARDVHVVEHVHVVEPPPAEPPFVEAPDTATSPVPEAPFAEPPVAEGSPAAETAVVESPVREAPFFESTFVQAPAPLAPPLQETAPVPVREAPFVEVPAAETPVPSASAQAQESVPAPPSAPRQATPAEPTGGSAVSETSQTELDEGLHQALTMSAANRSAGVFLVQLHLPPEYEEDWKEHGGEVMDRVRELLSSGRRRTDTVTPAGCGQFVVVCADVDSPATAELIASSMVRELSSPLPVGGSELPLIVSLGIVLTERGDEGPREPEALLEDASLALRLAWEEGQTWMVFDEAVGSGIRLREGLERAMDNGELGLDFQKVIDLQTSEVVGAEALLRWNRPGRDVLPAAEFVQRAYETGLGVSLGQWVLDRALSDLSSWRDRGSLSDRFRLSVNVAAEEVMYPQFAEMVEKLLREHGVPPAMLVLEMPEAALGDAAGDTHAVEGLLALRELGVSCVVDDFGTGRSNLDWLQELPVTGLKIAPELVGALDRMDDRRGPALVRGVIALGHELQMMVVGEGVESVSQAVALRAMGCDLAQGYYMGRPEHSDELAAALAS